MNNKKVDILIIGGGLTGATLLLALQGLGFSTLLVDAKPFSEKVTADFDARSIALSPASQRILNTLGIWDHLKKFITPIELIHVSDQHRFGVSRLQGDAQNPLGYVIEMQHINQALHHLLDKNQVIAPAKLSNLDLINNQATILLDSGEMTIDAQLLVAADGTNSAVRKFCQLDTSVKNYQQQAIVTNVGLAKAHGFRAFERFTEQGPLALLPMQGNKMSLVWSLSPDEATQLMNASEAEFLTKLQLAFGYRLGRFTQIGQRTSYPLQQVIMPVQKKDAVIFVGNAAHTLHPVAGQGFNLGLRDVATLAQCIAKQGLNADMLNHYLELRHHDQQAITCLTNGLISVFSNRLPGVGLARNLGLLAFDNIPILKKLLARYARGFGGITPDLVCEIALSEGV